MRILFVSPSFYPAFHYGGPIFINRSFCEAMARHDNVQLEVLTTDSNGPKQRIDVKSVRQNHRDSYEISYCRRRLPPDIAPGLMLHLFGKIRQADVVHLNGVYNFTTIPTLALCRLMQKPVAWSTMGALQRWEGTTRKGAKAHWERICNSLCEPERVVIQVTSEEEKTESLEKIPKASALILRNGIDIPKLDGVVRDHRGDTLRLLYIGRLHPIKGIENLLAAMTMVTRTVHLAICGEGEPAYEARLRSLVEELKLSKLVRFHGRVDGEFKEQHFGNADLCVAPSFKEAFCTVVLESLARAVPVIASHGIPWEHVVEKGCGLWVGNEAQELASAIDRAASMPLSEMGRRGRAWMQQDYSWSQVAAEMIAEYEALISRQRLKQKLFSSAAPLIDSSE
jgi:glycosyltransferase involved in cell wall biosynthesis